MINSKKKGCRVELEIAHILTDNYGITCRRSQQYCGTESSADLLILDTTQLIGATHIECKGIKHDKLEQSTLIRWIEQVSKVAPEDAIKVIICIVNGKQPVCLVPLESVERMNFSNHFIFNSECNATLNPVSALNEAYKSLRLQKILRHLEILPEEKILIAHLVGENDVLILMHLHTWCASIKKKVEA